MSRRGGARRGRKDRRRIRRGMTPDRDGAGAGTAASGSPRMESAIARHPDELREAARFGFGNFAAERSDAVVAAPLVIEFGDGALAGLRDETLFQHPLNGTIEGAGAQLELAVRTLGHVLDDGVP